MSKALTPRQYECLELIIRSIQKRGRPPKVKELCDRLMMANGSISHLISELEYKGYIARSGSTNGEMKLLRDLDGDLVRVDMVVTIQKVQK